MTLKVLRLVGTSSKNSIRKIFRTNIEQNGDRIFIELTGSGFLYNMVRIISGTLVDVGLGKIDESDIPKIILSGNRQMAGKTLPPQGLYLVKVEY